MRTIGWGWNSFPLGVGALPHDFAKPYVHYFTFDDARTAAEYTHGITLPMAPFLGVVAAGPAGAEEVSAILSGRYGGNLVLRDLGAGSHLFLPLAKPGARVWIGEDKPTRLPPATTHSTRRTATAPGRKRGAS